MNASARPLPTPDPPSSDAWTQAPLPAAVAAEARALIARLDERQRFWLAGYLAGGIRTAAAAPTSPPRGTAITVLYGSHTGNSERLARRIAARLAERGLRHELIDMLECRKADLQAARTLLVVVSTHGNGEPPERALPLFDLLGGRKAPRLESLRFAVLALGDSSYERFCETGRQFDARLEALGAARLHPRADLDVDFEVPAQRWIDGVVEALAAETPAAGSVGRAAGDGGAGLAAAAATVANAYTRKHPLLAPVLANQRLTATGSTKDVRHVELSLDGANLHYEPGDALGVVARNDPAAVARLLAALRFDPQAPVSVDGGGTIALGEALAERYEIGPVTADLLGRYARATGGAALAARLSGDPAAAAQYVRERHLVDVVTEQGTAGLDPASLVGLLRPLAPRLYSISSSQRATPGEVHLTVAVVDYRSLGQARRGLASGRIADATGAEASLPVYLHRNPGFRLPADSQAPVVMIGAGTGVAPFRAFVAERAALGATGRNWLFFGDRSFETDFLYQAEWIDWRKRGVLSRVDVAFSRDRAEKTYVQHRLVERGAELWRWLQEGACVYVCGDAERMAPDVHRSLRDLIARHGNLSAEAAGEYLVDLQRSRRYQRDVY